jgi:hypothetical protein
MAVFESEVSFPSTRHLGAGAAALFVGTLLVWAVLYFTGALPWLGYAWLKHDSFGAGPFSVAGEDRMGTSFGLDTFLFFRGQEIVVDYDAAIRTGSLMLYVYDMAKMGQGLGAQHFVTENGSGQWTTRIPRTGLYVISIRPSTAPGNPGGYDMSYRVWWGARPAP